MDIDQFAAQIEAVHQRVADLHQQSADAPVHRIALQLAFAELDTTLEELRAAEETLREHNQELLVMHSALTMEHRRYQELFDGAPDGYVVTTLAGTIQAANRAAGTLLNMSPHFVIGLPLVMFIADHDRHRFQDALSRLRSTGQLANWEVRLQPGSQLPVDVELSATAERDARGHIVALRWLLRDISARKQAEAEVAALHAQLERRVQERIAQLEAANQALVCANAAARAALRDREEFLAIAAHELKAPLSTLFGYIFILERSAGKALEDNARAQQALAVLKRDTKRLSSLIDQLLDLTRLETAPSEMDRQPLNLVELVEDSVKAVQPMLDQQTLDLQVPRTPVVIEGDVLHLEQVLRNLLQNAIQYSPNGGTITIRLEQRGDQVVLSVADQGIGIPAAGLPHLFERFYRAGNSQIHGHKGLGIGLYVVQQIVEHHGGTIEVVSQEGHGSTFIICLPRPGADTHATDQVGGKPV